jgi:hypothetical protein
MSEVAFGKYGTSDWSTYSFLLCIYTEIANSLMQCQ